MDVNSKKIWCIEIAKCFIDNSYIDSRYFSLSAKTEMCISSRLCLLFLVGVGVKWSKKFQHFTVWLHFISRVYSTFTNDVIHISNSSDHFLVIVYLSSTQNYAHAKKNNYKIKHQSIGLPMQIYDYTVNLYNVRLNCNS